ncbi:GpE family phage tail protein [Pseudomonas sp. RIT-PI-S]|nr:GpE family phage tail protein [Pseudomonas sp. RIT-PI-S]
MADIAMVFHWPPAPMATMPVSELVQWREQARQRWELTHGA